MTRTQRVIDAPLLLLGASLLLLLLAVLLPKFELPQDTYDYLVVFDITQSMNVLDYELDGAPIDRLSFTKHAVRASLKELPCGSRMGWGVFAEYRTVVLLAPVEVCSHFNDLLNALDEIDGRMRWGEASEVTKAVFWALRAVRDLGGNTDVIFLTDGQEAPPLDSTRPAVGIFDDIVVGAASGWIIGVGGETPQPIPRTDAEGQVRGYWRAQEVIQRAADPSQLSAPSAEHLSSVHDAHLRALAKQVGLQYRRLDDVAAINHALSDSRLATRQPVATDLYWLPAALALLLLVVKYRPR